MTPTLGWSACGQQSFKSVCHVDAGALADDIPCKESCCWLQGRTLRFQANLSRVFVFFFAFTLNVQNSFCPHIGFLTFETILLFEIKEITALSGPAAFYSKLYEIFISSFVVDSAVECLIFTLSALNLLVFELHFIKATVPHTLLK